MQIYRRFPRQQFGAVRGDIGRASSFSEEQSKFHRVLYFPKGDCLKAIRFFHRKCRVQLDFKPSKERMKKEQALNSSGILQSVVQNHFVAIIKRMMPLMLKARNYTKFQQFSEHFPGARQTNVEFQKKIRPMSKNATDFCSRTILKWNKEQDFVPSG